jgi:hypothetical protein
VGNKKIPRKNGNGGDIKKCLAEIANAGILYRAKRTTGGVLLTIATTRSGLRNATSQLVASREDVAQMVAGIGSLLE